MEQARNSAVVLLQLKRQQNHVRRASVAQVVLRMQVAETAAPVGNDFKMSSWVRIRTTGPVTSSRLCSRHNNDAD